MVQRWSHILNLHNFVRQGVRPKESWSTYHLERSKRINEFFFIRHDENEKIKNKEYLSQNENHKKCQYFWPVSFIKFYTKNFMSLRNFQFFLIPVIFK